MRTRVAVGLVGVGALLSGVLASQASAGGSVPQPATGTIVLPAAVALHDGEWFVLSDGTTGTSVFEFDKNGSVSPGAYPLALTLGESASQLRSAVGVAINGSGLGLVASGVGGNALDLVNEVAGPTGNQPILTSVASQDFLAIGMSGGSDDQTVLSAAAASGRVYAVPGSSLLDGDSVVISDGASNPVHFEFDDDGSVSPGSIGIAFQGTDSLTMVRDKVIAAVNGSDLGLTASPFGYGALGLVNAVVGSAGNVPMVENVADPNFVAQGMAGGRDGAPDLSISLTHSDLFTQRDAGAAYDVSVANVGADPTKGAVSVVDTLPTGLSPVSISGIGWTCHLDGVSCERSDPLGAGNSWPPIRVTVKVAHDASAVAVNTATVSGGGDVDGSNNQASDPTDIAAFSCPNGRTTAGDDDGDCILWLTTTAVTCLPDSVPVGATSACTAVVTSQVPEGEAGPPSGAITFLSDPAGTGSFSAPTCEIPLGSIDSRCTVEYTPAPGSVGDHEVTAAYGGDAGHAASLGKGTITASTRSTAVTLRCRPKTLSRGGSSVCRATVLDVSTGQAVAPRGKVGWAVRSSDGALDHASCRLVKAEVSAGCRVTFSARKKARGQVTIKAHYAGDDNHRPSDGQTHVMIR